MRVSAFLVSYPPHRLVGAELMSAQFLEALAHAGHEVTVYADLVTEAYERNGVRIKPRSTFIRAKRTADLVYSHPDVGSIGYVVSQLHRIPYVAVVHNTGDLNRWHLAHHKPTLTIWNSESTREQLGGKGGLVVRSPLKVKEHAAKAKGKAFTIINLSKAKGIDTFNALAKAHPEYPALAVQGGYGIQDTATPLSLGATVLDLVPHAQMPTAVWSKTKVLLMPSKEESWGRAATEALCSGIPVIAHPTPGLQDALGEAGIFIDRDDHEAWSLELKRLMEDQAAYEAASKAALKRARFLEKQTTQDLEAFLTACKSLSLSV